MGQKLPKPTDLTKAHAAITATLGSNALGIVLKSYRLDGTPPVQGQSGASTTITIILEVNGHALTIDGAGTGHVDATFSALAAHFQAEHPIVGELHVGAFQIDGHMEAKKLDADGTVRVTFQRGRGGHPVVFAHTDRSVSAASIHVVIQAVTFYINARLAARHPSVGTNVHALTPYVGR